MRHKSAAVAALPIAETLTRHVDALCHHYSAALDETQDSVEGIHKVRVTTRRLQADLDLLQFGRNSRIVRDIKQRLRDFRNGLSTLRNYDVFVSIVNAALERAMDAETGDLTALARRLSTARDDAARQGARIIKRFKLRSLTVMLLGSANGEAGRNVLDLRELDDSRIRDRAADRLETRLDEFFALVSRVQDASDAQGVHQLRIAAKRLRYLVETLSDLGFREPKGALRWLRLEQGRIGDWHDLFCLEAEVLGLVGKKEVAHGHLEESAALLRATSGILKTRATKASRIFPVKPPNYFERSIRRLVVDLRLRSWAVPRQAGGA